MARSCGTGACSRGRSRQSVHDEMTTELRNQQRGINIDPTKLTVGEFLATWLENTAKPSVRPKDVPLVRADGEEPPR